MLEIDSRRNRICAQGLFPAIPGESRFHGYGLGNRLIRKAQCAASLGYNFFYHSYWCVGETFAVVAVGVVWAIFGGGAVLGWRGLVGM